MCNRARVPTRSLEHIPHGVVREKDKLEWRLREARSAENGDCCPGKLKGASGVNPRERLCGVSG